MLFRRCFYLILIKKCEGRYSSRTIVYMFFQNNLVWFNLMQLRFFLKHTYSCCFRLFSLLCKSRTQFLLKYWLAFLYHGTNVFLISLYCFFPIKILHNTFVRIFPFSCKDFIKLPLMVAYQGHTKHFSAL